MQTIKAIVSALGVVAVIFGVPVLATLVAGQFGLAYRLIGWTTLVAMIVLAFQSRFLLARLLLGERKLAAVPARRAYKRR
ncbi:hypothetical protein [Sphingomonas sp. LHG3443-2]|uniref:hypothetical protein n=1 Tax=Sphingomonas sp. LHG3443-2 TaxID=2804639 RepID=UPI003CF9B6E1